MKEKVTINDIAKMCNVSKSSVSRYLNHGYVSKENAERIQAAIDETGFQSNFFASRIKRKDSHIIGIIVSSFAGYGIGKMLDGVLQTLGEENYQGMILQSQGKSAQENKCVQLLRQQGVDGILFLDSLFCEYYRDTFTNDDISVLFVNQECSYAPAISFDEEAAVISMLDYLKQKGHKRILYLRKEHHISKLREEAMIQNWNTEDVTCLSVALHEDGIYDQAKQIIKNKADVLICDSDEIALCCMKYYAQMHIRIPHELSIVSFSETPLFDAANPSLTHIAYDYEGFGTYLAANLLAHIQKGKDIEKQSFFKLIEKDSVASLK